ncbi:hypothetical protein OQJ26_19135, partial [Legionella sp. PATHC038]|uniref:hypothetical protein n=1 Tax=Legionella sheltonii TaxID=2992041 RepID=UPI002244DD0F
DNEESYRNCNKADKIFDHDIVVDVNQSCSASQYAELNCISKVQSASKRFSKDICFIELYVLSK